MDDHVYILMEINLKSLPKVENNSFNHQFNCKQITNNLMWIIFDTWIHMKDSFFNIDSKQ